MQEDDEELEKLLAAYRGSSKARLIMNIMRQWIRGLNEELKPRRDPTECHVLNGVRSCPGMKKTAIAYHVASQTEPFKLPRSDTDYRPDLLK